MRIALLEADVALPVVKEFIAGVRGRAVGQEVLRSVTPAQMVVKIVHDHLVEMLSGGEADEKLRAGEGAGINLAGPPPVAGAAGRPAGLRQDDDRRQARDPPAQAREEAGADGLARRLPSGGAAAAGGARPADGDRRCSTSLPGEQPVPIALRALDGSARRQGYDVVILDTAGRLTIDERMMDEAAAVKAATKPVETLLVADALTGQDAVTLARAFHEKVGITGIVLTRVDGDARGGAALSMRGVTGRPIRLIGVGEKLDALETFQPERIAGASSAWATSSAWSSAPPR